MALVAITVSNAQVVPVAILTSGDEVTTFYGKEALRHAHQAAKEGDVINLSPDSFLWTEINKGVSIIGSGVDPNSPDGYTRILTGFEGHMRLRHPESSELRLENLYMEARVLHRAQNMVKIKSVIVSSEINFARMPNQSYIILNSPAMLISIALK